MAKRKATTVTLTLPGGKTVEELDLSEIEAQLPDRSAQVQLYRQDDEEPTKWNYVGRMGASEFSLEAVKEEYGGGDYRGHLLDKDGKFTGTRFPFSIDRRAVPRSERGQQGNGISGNLAEELAEAREFQKTLLLSILTGKMSQPASSTDPMEMAVKIAELTTRQSPAALGASEVIKLLREGMALGADRPAAAADSMGAMVQAAAPLFGALATRITQVNQSRQVSPGPAAPAAPPAPSVPDMSPAMPTGPYAWLEHVRPYVPQLVAMAQAGKDPVILVDFVLDQLPDQFVDDMELAAKDARFVEEVLQRIPEARMQAPWFTAFLTELRKALLEDPSQQTNGQHS